MRVSRSVREIDRRQEGKEEEKKNGNGKELRERENNEKTKERK